MRIGMAAKDERGQYSGGRPGDQTHREVYIRAWYNRPWDVVLRWTDQELAGRFAAAVEAICNNDEVGYSQSARTTLWEAAARIDWDLPHIGEPCSCDCSSMLAVAARSIGLQIPRDIWTGNLERAFVATGKIRVLRDREYREKPDLLQRGDILLNTLHHVAVALDGAPERTDPVVDVSHYPEICRGYKGAYALLLQQALTARGFPCDQDGDFGPETRGQVLAFQRSRHLVQDGIVGQKTWYALFND